MRNVSIMMNDYLVINDVKKEITEQYKLFVFISKCIPSKDDSLLGYCAMQSRRSLPTFQKCLLLPSSGLPSVLHVRLRNGLFNDSVSN
jgi:hypothetical protein